VRVGDVAPRSAADEYFCARLLRAFEERDRARGVGAAREDGGGEAGGAGADDDDICDASILRAVTFEREPLEVVGELAKELVDRLVAAHLFGGGVVDAVGHDGIALLSDERSPNRSLHRRRRGRFDLKLVRSPTKHALPRGGLIERLERSVDGRHGFVFSHRILGVIKDHDVV
jgi:hypothetical protein